MLAFNTFSCNNQNRTSMQKFFDNRKKPSAQALNPGRLQSVSRTALAAGQHLAGELQSHKTAKSAKEIKWKGNREI